MRSEPMVAEEPTSTVEGAPPLRRGVFTFSLDFELAWGTRGRPSATRVGPWLDGAREAISGLLSLLEKYEVSATWASVGAMFLKSTVGEKRPAWLAGFDDVPAGDSVTQPHWYATDLLDKLLACRTPQEIGCHTLTHLLVDDGPAGREPFRLEIERFVQLFAELGLPRPESFIFPKHRMGHYDVLAEYGFRAVRGPEPKWFEALPGVRLSALMRLADARLRRPPVVGHPRRLPSGLWEIPCSTFYPPFMSVGNRVSVADRVAIARKGLRSAANRRSCFHLWTHPFNLGRRSDELLAGLDQILSHAARLRDEGRLDILPMNRFADALAHGPASGDRHDRADS